MKRKKAKCVYLSDYEKKKEKEDFATGGHPFCSRKRRNRINERKEILRVGDRYTLPTGNLGGP